MSGWTTEPGAVGLAILNADGRHVGPHEVVGEINQLRAQLDTYEGEGGTLAQLQDRVTEHVVEILQLEEEIERLKGCEEQSIQRGNDCIRYGRELVELRAEVERVKEQAAKADALRGRMLDAQKRVYERDKEIERLEGVIKDLADPAVAKAGQIFGQRLAMEKAAEIATSWGDNAGIAIAGAIREEKEKLDGGHEGLVQECGDLRKILDQRDEEIEQLKAAPGVAANAEMAEQIVEQAAEIERMKAEEIRLRAMKGLVPVATVLDIRQRYKHVFDKPTAVDYNRVLCDVVLAINDRDEALAEVEQLKAELQESLTANEKGYGAEIKRLNTELAERNALIDEGLDEARRTLYMQDIAERDTEIDRLTERAKADANEIERANDIASLVTRDMRAGVEEGIRRYAWWKDGVQYVGTCGTTLKDALKAVEGPPHHSHVPPQANDGGASFGQEQP